MSRTTLALDDDLLRTLKARAAQEGTTLATVTNRLLRLAMAREEPAHPYRLEFPTWEARTQPGVDLLDRDSLYERMDGRG